MQTPSLIAAGQAVYDIDLLRSLRGCRICTGLKVLCVIGAHRFEELPLIDVLFPALQHIYLFEPQAGPLEALHALARRDRRIRVFPFAVSVFSVGAGLLWHAAAGASDPGSAVALSLLATRIISEDKA
jgi:hypothetical protein